MNLPFDIHVGLGPETDTSLQSLTTDELAFYATQALGLNTLAEGDGDFYIQVAEGAEDVFINGTVEDGIVRELEVPLEFYAKLEEVFIPGAGFAMDVDVYFDKHKDGPTKISKYRARLFDINNCDYQHNPKLLADSESPNRRRAVLLAVVTGHMRRWSQRDRTAEHEAAFKHHLEVALKALGDTSTRLEAPTALGALRRMNTPKSLLFYKSIAGVVKALKKIHNQLEKKE